MRLIVLGSGGYHPNARRHTLCLAIPEAHLLLDAGSSLFRLPADMTGPIDLFLTHAHLDHVIGLTYYWGLVQTRPLGPIAIHGEAAKLQAVQQCLFSEHLFPKLPPYEFRPLPKKGELETAAGVRVRWFPLEHPGGSVGYRLDWPDRSLAYVTDTVGTDDPPYIEAIRGADLLLHECYARDEHAEAVNRAGHATTSQAAQAALRARVKRLVLLHINPQDTSDDPIDIRRARSIFPETEVAEDGAVYEF